MYTIYIEYYYTLLFGGLQNEIGVILKAYDLLFFPPPLS